MTVIPIVIGAFGTISGNAKARYGRLNLPDTSNRGHVCKLLYIYTAWLSIPVSINPFLTPNSFVFYKEIPCIVF